MSKPRSSKAGFHANWMALTAGLAVVVAIAAAAIAYSNRPLTHELAADMAIRNVTRKDAAFASWARADEGDVVEYRMTAKNIGSAALTDVALTFDPPVNRSVASIPSSCWFQRSDDGPRRSCAKSWSERGLQSAKLGAHDTMTAHVRYRVARPSCQQMLPLTNRLSADAAETDVAGDGLISIHVEHLSDEVPKSCRTRRSQLLFAIDQDTRGACSTWTEGALGSDRVACYPKGVGIAFAVYAVFPSERSAEAAYRGVRLGSSLTACGAWKNGHGAFTDRRRFRFKCSDRTGGRADLTWIEPRAHIVGYANVDGKSDPGKALAWWRLHG